MNRRGDEPTVRVGGVMAFSAVLKDFGVDPAGILAEAGIDPRLFDDPDNQMSSMARGRLLSLCAARTGCPHFGLLVGQRMTLQSFGLLGMVARFAPDVESTLRVISNALHVHSRGSVVELQTAGSVATLSYSMRPPEFDGNEQVGDGAVAMMMNIMTALCGDDFRPIEAQLAHRAPKDARPYRSSFRAPVRFDAEQYALVFSSRYLGLPSPEADPALKRLLQQMVDQLAAEYADGFDGQVRRILKATVTTDHCNLDRVAAVLSMHPRTVARRLAELDTSFQRLVDEVRYETARQLLQHTSMEISGISAVLGYSRASAFSRAFRRWSGAQPADWRARHPVGS